MKLRQLANLALKHVRNSAAEELYLRTGRDHTRPVAVYGMINEICNYRCRYCEYWRLEKYRDEMSIAEWQKALKDLKDFLGSYHIEFSGGEPYIKKGFLDLARFCHENHIKWGVTTNGSAFVSQKVIDATIAARPFNINMSIDSLRPEIHNYSRGIDQSLEKITKGIKAVIAARNAAGLDFPVIIKPVVHRLNFRYLTEMVPWITDELGATAINFQPVDRWSPETKNELWIDAPKELEELLAVRDELLAMKHAGAPILNSDLILSVWGDHFLEKKAPPEAMPCRVGMRNYFIRADGDVEVCWFFKPIGNVRHQTAREIWYSEEAATRRAETVKCESLCLFTCLSQKTVKDKLKIGMTLLTGGRKKRPAPTPPAGKKDIALPVLNK